MALGWATVLQALPGLLGEPAHTQRDDQRVGEREGHEQALHPFADAHLQPEPPDPQMSLEVAKALLDVHAPTIERDDLRGGQRRRRARRDDQIPGFLVAVLIVDDQIDLDGLLPAIANPLEPPRLPVPGAVPDLPCAPRPARLCSRLTRTRVQE